MQILSNHRDLNAEKMPEELQKICQSFSAAGLQYNFFKCEHIFQGANKNLDLLFLNQPDYQEASSILEKEGFLLYLGENVEKYKRMYVKLDKILTAVHLHREIAWHGIPVLDKMLVFERAKNNIPSAEDALLIHSAHALFENFKVTSFQKELLLKYRKEANDHKYISQHLSKFGWKKAFYQLQLDDFSIKKETIAQAYIGRWKQNPFLLYNFGSKIFTVFRRKISLKRSGVLIALSGVNGSGKTTIVNETLTAYHPITKFFHGQKGYYYGWDPFLPLTKALSRAAKKKKIYQELNQHQQKIGLKKEAIVLYNFVEYLARYFCHIYPLLRKGQLVITDRYFYDIYAQHAYAEKSKIIKPLLRLFPRPDYFCILNADVPAIINRDKNTFLLSKTAARAAQRSIHSKKDLEDQIRRYFRLKALFNGHILETVKPVPENVAEIIRLTWKSLVLAKHL